MLKLIISRCEQASEVAKDNMDLLQHVQEKSMGNFLIKQRNRLNLKAGYPLLPNEKVLTKYIKDIRIK